MSVLTGVLFGAFATDVRGMIVAWLFVGFASSDAYFVLVYQPHHSEAVAPGGSTYLFQVVAVVLCATGVWLGHFLKSRWAPTAECPQSTNDPAVNG